MKNEEIQNIVLVHEIKDFGDKGNSSHDYHNSNPLCVDLDGTLLSSDLLFESFLFVMKRKPWMLLLIPWWLLKGRACLKEELAQKSELDIGNLPYRKDVVDWLNGEHVKGRQLILATASHQKFANQVAEHLGIFSKVMASDGVTNLNGQQKANLLVKAFGKGGFDYVGNSRSDLKVWPYAQNSILVCPNAYTLKMTESLRNVSHIFPDKEAKIGNYWKALRPHQWVKNILLFLPLLAAHKISSHNLLISGIAFFSFSFCASSVYILNDLLDLSSDRLHPRKRFRPFASGKIPILNGLFFSPILLGLSIALALLLPIQFLGVLGGYYLLTLSYSWRLKNMVLVDVFALGALYTLRLIAGGFALNIPLSFWILAFSGFLFLSLALIKRYAELIVTRRQGEVKHHGRNYHVEDYPMLMAVGIASGFSAVIVLSLYINSSEINRLYSHPKWIWMLCPLVLYWIMRIWMVTHRGFMHDDPVVFAVKDRISIMVGILFVIVIGIAL